MKRFFTSLVLATCALIGYAQQPTGTLSVKPFVGATFTKQQPITNDKVDMKAGIVAGAELEYQILEKASIAGGVQFLTQGSRAKQTSDDGSYIVRKSLNAESISIPFTFNYYVIPNLAIKAGVECNIPTRTQMIYKQNEGKFPHDLTIELTRFLVSLPIGVSYEYNNFVLDARYSLPLSNISKGRYMALDSVGEFPLNGKFHTFQITLGYKFNI